jgi:hypothetical protein
MASPPTTSFAGKARSYMLLAAILALILLALAWPRLRAALIYLPVDAAIERYYIDGETPLAALAGLQQRARQSAALHSHQEYWSGLALLYHLQALDGGQPLAAQREAYEQSVAAADRSLALAPVQPRTWLFRALAQSWLSFRDAGVIDSFKMSVYTGRVEPALLLTRLRLGYARLGQLDDEARGLLRDQTMLAWRLQPRDVTLALKRGELDLRRVASLFGPADADVLRELKETLGEEAVGGAAR